MVLPPLIRYHAQTFQDADAGGGSAEAEKTLHALVGGRVQGVGFRFHVYGIARRLGLSGSVRNLPDGRVEVLARGSGPALEQLLEALRQGSRMSRVEDVQAAWGVVVPQTTEFIIGF